MASGGPMMNGDISRSPSQSGTLEETLQQMNILIQENRDLKGESVFLGDSKIQATHFRIKGQRAVCSCRLMSRWSFTNVTDRES